MPQYIFPQSNGGYPSSKYNKLFYKNNVSIASNTTWVTLFQLNGEGIVADLKAKTRVTGTGDTSAATGYMRITIDGVQKLYIQSKPNIYGQIELHLLTLPFVDGYMNSTTPSVFKRFSGEYFPLNDTTNYEFLADGDFPISMTGTKATFFLMSGFGLEYKQNFKVEIYSTQGNIQNGQYSYVALTK